MKRKKPLQISEKGFQFGDIVVNGWASENNPQRIGYFVRVNKRTFLMTDGHGKFWETMKSNSRLNMIGNIRDKELCHTCKQPIEQGATDCPHCLATDAST